jgi:hypothetical protein
MARDGFDAGAVPKTTKQTPPDISLLRAKNGLDNGVHFTSLVFKLTPRLKSSTVFTF